MANRMRVEDWLKHHPEVLEAPVEQPMFVFGLPRTGTTLMINLLAADPATRSTAASLRTTVRSRRSSLR